MWIFSKLIRCIKQWNRQRRNLREVKKLAKMFGYIEELVQRGNIYWKEKDNILLIEEHFALLKIAEGKKGFQKFLNQISAWQNYQLIRDAYEAKRIEIETKAVREAQKQVGNLTNTDILRIRQNARAKMEVIPPEKLDMIREFDIMVIRANAISPQTAKEENGQLLALGHYDGSKVEMAMYDDIKHNLNDYDE